MSDKENKAPRDKKRTKKEKIIYIDDGSSFADMSSVSGVGFIMPEKRKKTRSKNRFFDCLKTYFDSVRFYFLPMLVVLGILALAFFIMWVLLGGLQTLS